MGEAAEWAIWSRYGVDISDDGDYENASRRRSRKYRQSVERQPEKSDYDWEAENLHLTGIRSYDDAASAAADMGDVKGYARRRVASKAPNPQQRRKLSAGTWGMDLGSGGGTVYAVRDEDGRYTAVDRGTGEPVLPNHKPALASARALFYGDFAELEHRMLSQLTADKLYARTAKGEWVRGDGTVLRVDTMENGHLKNAIAWCERNGYGTTAALLQQEQERRKEASKGSKTMDTKEIISIMQLEAGAKLVQVQFERGGKSYVYKDVIGHHLVVGELVVVESSLTDKALATVTSIDVNPATLTNGFGNLKHVMARVDLSSFELVTQRETEARNKLAMAEVTQRLDAYRKQFGGFMDQAASVLLGRAESVPPFGGRVPPFRSSPSDFDWDTSNDSPPAEPAEYGDRSDVNINSNPESR